MISVERQKKQRCTLCCPRVQGKNGAKKPDCGHLFKNTCTIIIAL